MIASSLAQYSDPSELARILSRKRHRRRGAASPSMKNAVSSAVTAVAMLNVDKG